MSRGTTPLQVSKQSNSQNIPIKGKKGSNNQQLKGLMAAALASAKQPSANQKHSVRDEMDENELMIMKANSVNQKYMTDIITTKKETLEDQNAYKIFSDPGDLGHEGSDYVQTDEDDEAEEITTTNQGKKRMVSQ